MEKVNTTFSLKIRWETLASDVWWWFRIYIYIFFYFRVKLQTRRVLPLLFALIYNRVDTVKVKSYVALLVQMRVNAFGKLVTVKRNVKTTETIQVIY